MNSSPIFFRYGDLAFLAILLALVPAFIADSPYYLRIATLAVVYMGWTVAFNLIFGHTKQLFLCLGALAGSSAYMTAVLTQQLQLSPWITIPLGVTVAASLGALFSYVSVLRGLGVIFLGIVTLAFSLIFQNLVLGLRRFTNGETGLITRGLGFPLLDHPVAAYYLFVVVLALALLVYCLVMGSRMGIAFRALSDDELTAELSGVDVTACKVIAAALGSATIGLGGSLFGFYNGIISPSLFSFVNVDIPVLISLLLGGMRTRLGPIIGAAAFAVIEEFVRPFGRLNVLVDGVLLIVLFVAFREGLVAMLGKLWASQFPDLTMILSKRNGRFYRSEK
jgi:branched-chain amino acid transport system permease protein